MSGDESPDAPAARDRREAVREKAQLVQAKQSRAMVIRRVSLGVVIVGFVVAAAVVITWVVASAASRPLLTPQNMDEDGVAVAVTGTGYAAEDVGEVPDPDTAATASPTPTATPTATPTPTATAQAGTVDIRVYVDYLSSGSRQFQMANAEQLTEWVTQGAATLTYHPIALLTAKSNGTKYSLRAASAAACVATNAPDSFFAYNHELLVRQPEVDTDGFSDVQLADIATAVGAEHPKLTRKCIEAEDYAPWVLAATERALAGPLPGADDVTLTGAPMVLVNGTPYVGALDDPQEFAQFVLTLSSEDYYDSTATPTPTPTATR